MAAADEEKLAEKLSSISFKDKESLDTGKRHLPSKQWNVSIDGKFDVHCLYAVT